MAKEMMRVRFLEDRVVNDHRKGTPREERYKKGATVDLPRGSALRWIVRGVAVEVTGKGKGAAPAELQKRAAPGRRGGGSSRPKPTA